MSKMTSRNTPASAPAISQRTCCALAKGTESGTVTIWAPMISLSFQPKPFCRPYAATIAWGAASGVSWQRRQFLVTTRGWDKFRTRPPWVSRSVTNSVLVGLLRKSLIMSASQSVARCAGLVGLRAGSR